jgi:predicted alpha/beta-fold hydrolase
VLPSKKVGWVIGLSSSTSGDVSCKGCQEWCPFLRSHTGAGVPITNPLFYSAGHTDDTRNALMYVASRYPKARLLGLGFSLGANVITRYLGEEREMARLHSACVLACVGSNILFLLLPSITFRSSSLGICRQIIMGTFARTLLYLNGSYHLI